MGVVHTGAVAGKPAVAGGLNTYVWNSVTKKVDKTAVSGSALAADITAAEVARNAALADVAAKQTALLAANAVGLAAAKTNLENAQGALAAAEAQLADRQGTAAVDAVAAKTALDSRFTVNVDASTETSSGLTFGASMRLRSNNAGAAGTNGARVYMKSGAVEVAVGNIYGAIDSMPGLYQSEAGLVGNGAGDVGSVAGGYDGYATNKAGSNGVEVIYSAGAFTGHLSVTDKSIGSNANRTAAHVAYTMNDWTAALGMQSSDVAAEDLTAFTVSGKVGDASVGLSGMRANGKTKITLNGGMTFGATSVSAFVSDDTSATGNAYGVGFAHDLGGASLVGAVERNSDGTNYADLGVAFSF